MENSAIEWTDHTFNPWQGCTKVSDGCKNCYAEQLVDKRWGKVKWGPGGTRIRTSADNWKQPLKWNREKLVECGDCGFRRPYHQTHDFCSKCDGESLIEVRARVFCASLADIFEDKADQREEMDAWRAELWALIEATPNLDWLLLTKRPENVAKMMPKRWGCDPELGIFDDPTLMPPHIQIGTSPENQNEADKRVPELLKIPARVRFLSCEPLLGPINLMSLPSGDPKYPLLNAFDGMTRRIVVPGSFCDICSYDEDTYYEQKNRGIHWVIVGGESGANARPMHPDWARHLRDQCVAHKVAYFFKQWGESLPRGQCFANGAFNHGLPRAAHDPKWDKCGKKAAGRLLDGVLWSEFPRMESET